MDKYPVQFCLFTKFGLLGEILPFYGHLPLWQYLLGSLSIRTKELWNNNQHAFKVGASSMVMSVIEYERAFDVQFREYLQDPEVLLNNRIQIKLKGSQECFNLFDEFLQDCLDTNKRPVFDKIVITEKSIGLSYFAEPLYNKLKLIGNNQESILSNNGSILSSRYMGRDPFTVIFPSKLVDSEYVK